MKYALARVSFLVAWTTQHTHAEEHLSYSVDCSFPIHSKSFRCDDILGDRYQVYEDYMEGCRKLYDRKANRCDESENDRIALNVMQPQSMVNYTETGYLKVRAPNEIMASLSDYWRKNRLNMRKEEWPVGNVYTNHWKSPTYMVDIADQSLRGGGHLLTRSFWEAAKDTVEEWTGMEQQATAMYGIRVYTEGAIVSPRVDRLPSVTSCIINVDQDEDEPWPLEIYDRSGQAVNITMEPGDMLIHESASIIHGRPFPLNGRFYANVFVHFEPTGRPLRDNSQEYFDRLDDFLPPYLLPNSPEVENWVKNNPQGWKHHAPSAPSQPISSPEVHVAAAMGDIDRLIQIVERDRKALHMRDVNGWRPLHEAVRAGHREVVEWLIENAVDRDARTGPTGRGSSPLNLALLYHSEDHPVSRYLMDVGAKNIAEGEL